MQQTKSKQQRRVPPANCPTWARNPAPVQDDDEAPLDKWRSKAILDEELEDDESLYPRRPPNSTRRYQQIQPSPAQAPARTHIRVTHHAIPKRATATPTQEQTPRESPVQHRRGFHPHPLLWIGLALCVMVGGWMLLSMVVDWWQVYQNDLHYGRPRTYQTDMVVGHNDSATNPSHFIALNLHDHIQILEFPGGDASKAKVYLGPTLAPGHELDPVTVSFKDVNGDGKLDLVITVDDLRFVFINENGAFRPPHEGEKVNV